MTYGDIVNRVLRNCGDTRGTGTAERLLILQDLTYLLRHDLPSAVGEIYTEGSFDLTLGGVLGSSDGEYTVPNGVRSIRGPVTIDGDILPGVDVHRSVARFWDLHDPDPASATVGKPTAMLIHGLTLVFRPIPDFGGATSYASKIYGTLWPSPGSVSEPTEVPRTEYEGPLEAGGTVIHASRNKLTEVITLWAPLWERWLDNIASGSTDWVNPSAGESRYL